MSDQLNADLYLALSPSPEASARLHGEMNAAREAGMDLEHWRIKRSLDTKGLPWTRENYIKECWLGAELPDPDLWEEDALPPDLQDWSEPSPS